MNRWILAARIKTLPAAISPVMIGIALAHNDQFFKLMVAAMTLCAAVLIQIGANFANDVYDFLKGSDTDSRLGPQRATQSGLITPSEMKRGMWIIFSLAIAVGFYLAWVGGWPIVWIGLASITVGIAYTGGPYPLGYHGWGDVFVFIFFGLIAVPGTYYLQSGFISEESILLGLGMGALSTAILIVNNLRDADTDLKSGKRTLAVIMGKNFVRYQYSAMMLIAFAIPIIFLVQWENQLSLFLPFFTLPIAVLLNLKLFTESGESLNIVLASTARLLFLYTLLFSIGIVL